MNTARRAESAWRRGGCRAILAALLPLLAACAGSPPRPAPTPAEQSAAKTRPPTPNSNQALPPAPRGGAFYKDDGPGENVPPNLDNIPDAVPRVEPIRPSNSAPYVALGQAFTPMGSLQPYAAEGIASWYGKKFHGAKTASGEIYDMYAMTAAHPTLPIPSYARVTNLDNGKSVVVRINDRGPFHKDRLIDLSYTAAYKLGYVGKGFTRVEVTSIMPEGVQLVATRRPVAPVNTVAGRLAAEQSAAALTVDTASADETGGRLAERLLNGEELAAAEGVLPPAAPATSSAAPASGIFLQLGAFSDTSKAESFRDYVMHELKDLRESLNIHVEGSRYRLQLGPFKTQSAARQRAQTIVKRLKLNPFLVQR